MGLEAASQRGAGGGKRACQRPVPSRRICIFFASQGLLIFKFAEANPPGLPGPAPVAPPLPGLHLGAQWPLQGAPQGGKGQLGSEPQRARHGPLCLRLGISAWVGEQVVDSAKPAPPTFGPGTAAC